MKNKEIKGALLALALVGVFFGAQWVVLILLLGFLYLLGDEAMGEDTNPMVKMVFGIVCFLILLGFVALTNTAR